MYANLTYWNLPSWSKDYCATISSREACFSLRAELGKFSAFTNAFPLLKI